MSVDGIFGALYFSFESRLNQPCLATSGFIKGSLNFGEDLVQESRNAVEDRWLEYLAVLSKFEGTSLIIANLRLCLDSVCIHDLLKHMGKWQVGTKSMRTIWENMVNCLEHDKQAFVTGLDSLRVSSSP